MNIALDIGNVLCRLRLEAFTTKLLEFGHIQNQEEGMYFLKGVQAPLDIGMYGLEEAALRYFINLSGHELQALYTSWNEAVIEVPVLNDWLATTDHNVALLSNIGSDHAKLVRGFNGFRDCIQHFSFEVGARKPTKLYYQSFMMEHPEFRGALYIDDLQENLAVGSMYGLKCAHFSLEEHDTDEKALSAFMHILDEFENGIPTKRKNIDISEF